MLESEYKRQIREALTDAGAKVIPLITGEMTNKGEPDIIGVYKGTCFVIEAKVVGNHQVTEIQQYRLDEWKNAGALVLIPYWPLDTVASVVRKILGQR